MQWCERVRARRKQQRRREIAGVTGMLLLNVQMSVAMESPVQPCQQHISAGKYGHTAQPADFSGQLRQKSEQSYPYQQAAAEGNHTPRAFREGRDPQPPVSARHGYCKCNC